MQTRYCFLSAGPFRGHHSRSSESITASVTPTLSLQRLQPSVLFSVPFTCMSTEVCCNHHPILPADTLPFHPVYFRILLSLQTDGAYASTLFNMYTPSNLQCGAYTHMLFSPSQYTLTLTYSSLKMTFSSFLFLYTVIEQFGSISNAPGVASLPSALLHVSTFLLSIMSAIIMYHHLTSIQIFGVSRYCSLNTDRRSQFHLDFTVCTSYYHSS